MGVLIEKALMDIEIIYPGVFVDDYVVMPNHIHLVLVIGHPGIENSGRPVVAPTVSRVIQQFKGVVIKRSDDKSFAWQRSYYEHIIHSEAELREIYQYIENNPAKWLEDEYFLPMDL